MVQPLQDALAYNNRVDQGLEYLRRVADQTASETTTLPTTLLKTETRNVLEYAIASVSVNLLERDQEARLLSMLCLVRFVDDDAKPSHPS
jgi:hypothetical protein